MNCTRCNGTGDCTACEGAGRVTIAKGSEERWACAGTGFAVPQLVCDCCGGTGDCTSCGGSGERPAAGHGPNPPETHVCGRDC